MKKLKLYDLNYIPDGLNYGGYDISELSDYEVQKLIDFGVERAWYWYAQGSYEGSGQILMLKDGLYYLHDMGHCSCYGPVEDLELKNGTDLKTIEAACSKEYLKSVLPLIKKARAAEKRRKV